MWLPWWGRLSALRFPADERPAVPLYAASAPALSPTAGDPRSGVVLTVIHHEAGCTASVLGSGLASTSAGAEAFLDVLAAELAGSRASAGSG